MQKREIKNIKKDELLLYVEKLGKCLFTDLDILHSLCNINFQGRPKEAKIVVASACSTGSAIHALSKNYDVFYSETIMLARSFIEKIINYCYLQVCDDSEFERFFLHPLYRAFHNSDKSKYAGKSKIGIYYSGKEVMKNDPQMKRALAVFSETNPRMDWSKLKIDQKVAAIAEKSSIHPESFLVNTLSVYSDASEALHGSLYGCALPTGAYSPGVDSTDVKEVIKDILKKNALLYFQMGCLVHSTLEILADNEEVKILLEESNKNSELSLEIFKLIFEKTK